MTFLAPLFLLGAAAAVVPIVLHLLKREQEPRVRFAAVAFLKHGPIQREQKRRISDPLLLALRVAAIALLAIAFAHPFFPARAAADGEGATVIALDVSYSMSAPNRFERARALSKQAIANAAAGDAVGVITFDDHAAVVAAPTADRTAASQAVDRATPGFGGTRYAAALAAAVESAAGRRVTIVVVTDLQAGGWKQGEQALVPESARVEVADVGPIPDNFAVTGLDADGERVAGTIRNSSPNTREAQVSLSVDGRTVTTRQVSIAANGSAEIAFPPARRGAAVTVTVADSDGLQADNVRYAVAGSSRPTVLVIASGALDRDAFYLEQALTADSTEGPAYEVAGLTPTALGQSADAVGRADVVVLLSTRGIDRRGRDRLADYLRNGGGLLIAAGPDVDGALIQGVLGAPGTIRIEAVAAPSVERAFAPTDVRHPVFATLASDRGNLALARFSRIAHIAGEGCDVIARFTTGETAMLDCSAGTGRGLIFASDLDRRWNDFPVHPSYVPFVTEALKYLGGRQARSGQYLVAEAPRGSLRAPGFIEGPGGGRASINVSPDEGVPARLSVASFQSTVIRLEKIEVPDRALSRRQEERQHLWQYVLGIMILVLVAESVVVRRHGHLSS